MSCCGDDRKFSCGGLKTSSVCINYRGYLPKYSKLNADCAVIEETTEELYKNQEFILKSIDTSKLKESCIDYPTTEIDGEDKILVVDVLQSLQDVYCDLNDNIMNHVECIDVSKLDLKCLGEEPCSSISSPTDLMQMILDKMCEIEYRLKQLELP